MEGVPVACAERLYAAAFDAALWPEALESIADAIGASGAMLHSMAVRPEDSVMHIARLRADLTELYLKHYQHNPLSRMLIQRGPQEIIRSMALMGAEVRRTDFHADILAPQRIAEFVNYLHADWTDALTGGFGFSFDSRQTEDMQGRMARLAALSGHLTLALDLSRQQARASRLQWSSLLDASDDPMLLLRADGRPIAANQRAEAVIRHGEWLALAQGRLQAARVADRPRLRAALQAAAEGRSPHRGDSRVAIRATGESPPCIAIIASAPLLPVNEIGLPQPAVVLILKMMGGEITPGVLRELFALTPAEERIAAAIGRGMSLRAASDQAGIALSTGRSHLKTVFDKVGVRSQSGLASVIARLSGT